LTVKCRSFGSTALPNLLAIPLMGGMSRTRLRNPVGTIKQYRDDIVRAIDWLFTGV
jgi:hypothetical protein